MTVPVTVKRRDIGRLAGRQAVGRTRFAVAAPMSAFVPSPSQRDGQFLLDQFFDEAPDPIPDPRLDRVRPSFPQKQLRVVSQSSCYPSSWRDLRRRDNAGPGWLNKPEITPPPNSNHSPDGTAPHRIRERPDRAHDGTITTEAVDVLWGTDMTQSVTLAEGVAHVFVAVDHCNSECVGIHADKSANRFQALEPLRQGVRRHFGAIGKDVAAGLMLRHDHGPNYMSDDFQSEIAFLGIETSPSFVRQPEGNGVAERFIRTLKENLLWVRHFETIEELRLALLNFAAWYNTHWLVARHGHRTPAQIRADQQPAMDQAA